VLRNAGSETARRYASVQLGGTGGSGRPTFRATRKSEGISPLAATPLYQRTSFRKPNSSVFANAAYPCVIQSCLGMVDAALPGMYGVAPTLPNSNSACGFPCPGSACSVAARPSGAY
jgi:hypothetical protein